MSRKILTIGISELAKKTQSQRRDRQNCILSDSNLIEGNNKITNSFLPRGKELSKL